MNSKELRIGNLLQYPNCDTFQVTVPALTFPIAPIESHPKPIPLTEEWLVKFGFIKSPAGNSLYLSVPQLKAEIHFEGFRGELVCVIYCITGSFIPNDIKTVHKLQNLYFALTGEELELQS